MLILEDSYDVHDEVEKQDLRGNTGFGIAQSVRSFGHRYHACLPNHRISARPKRDVRIFHDLIVIIFSHILQYPNKCQTLSVLLSTLVICGIFKPQPVYISTS